MSNETGWYPKRKEQNNLKKAILIAIALLFTACSNPDKEIKQPHELHEPQKIEEIIAYEVTNINKLLSKEPIENKFVTIKGKIAAIDSDGTYIGLSAITDEERVNYITCNITEPEQLDIVYSKTLDDTLTVKGQILGLDSELGYIIEIHGIN